MRVQVRRSAVSVMDRGRTGRLASRPSSLMVGRDDDRAEVEADEFAARLMGDLAARPTLLRRSPMTATADPLGGSYVSVDVESRIRSASGGRSLPSDVRRAVEERSGRDLSGVRVHTGPEADELSSTLQAEAFTAGSDVFFSKGAYRPGTPAGDEVLAHELGHVVQQGGGAAEGPVQRRGARRPLDAGRPVQVQRLLGKKKTAAEKADAAATKVSGEKVVTVADLEKQIVTLEKALAKLVKGHKVGNAEDQKAAYLIKQAADKILSNLPDQEAKSSRVLGRQYPQQVKRLKRIMDEAQLIWDEYLVEATRKKATNIYTQAGQRAGEAAEAGKVAGFTKLTAGAKKSAFAEQGPVVGTDAPTRAQEVEATGKALGLSKGEIAAIATFTVQDYKYINPATANSMDWMKAANENPIDKANPTATDKANLRKSFKEVKLGNARERWQERQEELKTLREEGSLHAGVAMQGLLKMPVWRGTTYRGETMTKEKFESMFAPNPNGRFRVVKSRTDPRPNISSTSKSYQVALAFVTLIAKCPPDGYRVIWQYELTNGRDLELLSLNEAEQEVATLPGAEFGILSVEKKDGPMPIYIVKCRQRK